MGDVEQRSKKTKVKLVYHPGPAKTNESYTQQERIEKLLVIKYVACQNLKSQFLSNRYF